MAEQDPLKQNPALGNVERIVVSEGQLLKTHEDIQNLVEGPAIPAVTELWDKNVGTMSSSANAENGAYIDVHWDSLSEENKAIARDNGLVGEEDPSPRVIKLSVETSQESTEDDVATGLSEAASIFKPQELKWAETYTVDEMKKVYGYSRDEELNPSEIEAEGYFFAPDGKFHLSEELYKKSLIQNGGEAEKAPAAEAKLSDKQVSNLNRFIHDTADHGRALEAMNGAENQMDNIAREEGLDPKAGKIAVVAAALGSLSRNPTLLNGHGGSLARRLEGEFGMESQDVGTIMRMLQDFSKIHGNINRAADVIHAGLSYVRSQEAQGKDINLLAIAVRAGVVGAIKEPSLRQSVMRDLAGNKPIY